MFQKISEQHFPLYKEKYSDFFENFKTPKSEKIIDTEYLLTTSAVFSANIEGNSLDLNSFVNAKNFQKKFPQRKEEKEIQNLLESYLFALKRSLTEKNLLNAHKISSETLLPESQQGKYRDQKVGVFGKEGLIYMAVEPENVEEEMEKLFQEIKGFLKRNRSNFPTDKHLPSVPFGHKGEGRGVVKTEVFFFASYIHLRFAHIHPFMDGNGRMARILEKWILAETLGEEYWYIQTEEVYKNNRSEYYQSINLGINFYELNYSKAFPFLEMLPKYL